ncbi:MAG: trigger factor [Chthonomonas sp.]|nr:trigger factor [Chthonomonas sp.]
MATATPKMTVKRTDLNKCTIQFDVTCTPDQVSSGTDRAYKDFAKNMRVPGFRPGHAPKNVIAPMIPQQDLAQRVAEIVVDTVIRKLVTDEKIALHDSPAVNLTKFDFDKGECEFTAKLPLAPIVELGEYKGIEVEKPAVDVSDKDVDEYLEELRKRMGKRESVTDRGAQDGDVALVNVRGEKEDGDGTTLLLVLGKNFAALDKAIAGLNAEEMKVASLDFPADFSNKALAGKKGKWKLTVKSLNAVVLPQLSDEFAQNLGGDLAALKSADLKALKDRLRLQVEAQKGQMAQEMVHEQIQEKLVAGSKIEVPDTMWESVANQRMNELAQQARQQGTTIEEYAKANGMTVEEMLANWQAEAKTQVMRAVAAREIFAKEKLRLTNQDMNEMLIAMSYEYQVAPAELVKAMQKANNFRELEIRAVFKKVLDFLTNNASMVEAGTAKPAKKKAEPKEAAATEEKPKAEKPKAEKATAEKKPAPKKK